MNRIIIILLFVISMVCCSSKISGTVKPPKNLPSEVDTLVMVGTVKITDIKGNILIKDKIGKFSKVHNEYHLKSNDMMLVPKGASFRINGGDQIGPEYHGDRWIKIKKNLE